jgi:trimethylamine:corrinoid methyltransferase-like protein
MGLLGSAQILSLEKMVLDNHLTRRIEIMTRPVLVDEAHLQADLIERVGIGGHYLSQRETQVYTQREYVPVWPPAGKTMLEIAREEALEILHTHQPPPLPTGAAEQIDAIMAEAEKALAPA